MKGKKSIADIAIELMKKNGCTQLNLSEYHLLNQIAEKAKHTSLSDEENPTIRHSRILDSISRDRRFKKSHKMFGYRSLRSFNLIES